MSNNGYVWERNGARRVLFSSDRSRRFQLIQDLAETAGPSVLFVMLNPSTADAFTDDPTVSRLVQRCQNWGASRLSIANLFSIRTPSPAALKSSPASQRDMDGMNAASIRRMACNADIIILGWGTAGAIDDRGRLIWRDLAANGHRAHVLRLTSGGHPAHPLYLSYDCQPFWPRSLYGVDNVRPHASNKRSARYAFLPHNLG